MRKPQPITQQTITSFSQQSKMNSDTSTNSNDGYEPTAAVAAATTVRLADTSASASSKQKGVFPEILFKLLNDAEEEGFDNIVSWMPDGSSFKVHDRQKFETQIMPRYFSSDKFRSFQKSLLLWGYHSISMSIASPDRGVLRHPVFDRDCTPEMLQNMQRRKLRNYNESGNKFAKNGTNEKKKKTSGNRLRDEGVLAAKVAPHLFVQQPNVGQPLFVRTPTSPSRKVASFPPTQNTIDSILRAEMNSRNSSILAADQYAGGHSHTGDDLQRAALLGSLLRQQRTPPPPQVVAHNDLAGVHSQQGGDLQRAPLLASLLRQQRTPPPPQVVAHHDLAGVHSQQGGDLRSITLLSSLLQQQQAPPPPQVVAHNDLAGVHSQQGGDLRCVTLLSSLPPQVVAHNDLAGVHSQQGGDLRTTTSALAASALQQLPPLSIALVLREPSGVHSQGGGDIKTTADALLASATLQQSNPREYEDRMSSLHRQRRQMEIRDEFFQRVGDEIADLLRTGTL